MHYSVLVWLVYSIVGLPLIPVCKLAQNRILDANPASRVE